MTPTTRNDDDQAQLWNGTAGRAWVDAQPILDGTLRPFEDLLVEAVEARSPSRLLDVGCGTGSTTVAFARRVPECVGVDVSAPMLAHARARAEREASSARFVCADAQTHAFAPASHDMIVSRFGVMFFGDPVAAFANLRRAAEPGAALRFVAWRSAAENPFMTTAERAAAPLLPEMPPRQADGPGQFAFGERQRVERILGDSGWGDIEVRPIDLECTLPRRELVQWVTRLGPLGGILAAQDEASRARVLEAVLPAFDPFVDGDELRFPAACWWVGARAS